MGYWDAPEDQIVASKNVWYVQTALTRGLDLTLDQIFHYESLVENENLAGSIRDSFSGFLSYQRQWLREAYEMALTLPPDLQPHREVMAKVKDYFDKRRESGQGY
jgi:hypothetical protein